MGRMILFAMAVLLAARQASADFITYSSSGIVRPIFFGGSDPWGLGQNDTPFTFSVTLDSASLDVDPLPNVARFDLLESATFIINGQTATVQSAGNSIRFQDGGEGPPAFRDFISGDLQVVFGGVQELIGVFYILPASTFAFDELQEDLPRFGNALNAVDNTSSGQPGQNYMTFADLGTVVSSPTPAAVPEPSSLVLLGVTGVGVAIGAVRRRRRVVAA